MAMFMFLGLTQGQEDASGFGDFINNVFLDNQFSNDFFAELMAAKYVFQNERKFIFTKNPSEAEM